MKDDFFIKIETWHKPDLGTSDNVRAGGPESPTSCFCLAEAVGTGGLGFTRTQPRGTPVWYTGGRTRSQGPLRFLSPLQVHELDPSTWKTVEVVHIDIADRSQVEPGDYKADEDPALFQSVKTKRGPLGADWKKELAADEDCPEMCAYKLVTIKFKWWGLQNKIENFIQKQEKRIFTNFHRQLFCWIDRWIDLTMEDIRRMEDETQRELEAVRVLSRGLPAWRTSLPPALVPAG
uniref:Phosphatidylinositol transfer protein beta isoform n=1 Tax=Varanus komodoensis TaxID=61221 RepID=A0A8D2IXT1_VARKO